MGDFNLEITDRLLSTTRAVRKRLNFDRNVDLQVIMDCLELAIQAPTGSNRQGWRWLVITDKDLRKKLAELYRKGAADYLENGKEKATEIGFSQDVRVFESAIYLAENLQNCPVYVIPCIEANLPENPPRYMWAGLLGSVMPATWSFQLALRARGLGSVLTTLHLRCEEEAGKLLGIPDNYMQVALIPVAYTLGGEFKPANRKPLKDIVHFNTWN